MMGLEQAHEPAEREIPEGFRLAYERAGSLANLARLCGVTRSAVKQWEAEGLVPVPRRRGETNRVLLIERELGVHRHLLNPVVYPEPPALAALSQ